MESERTKRLLSLYYLFYYCEEVELRELDSLLPVSRKTLQRDLQYLRRAALIRYRFDRHAAAYLPQRVRDGQADWPDNKTQRRYMERIIRLARMMTGMWYDDPLGWYGEHYPDLTPRTRQRDFALLRELGWEIERVPAWLAGEPGRWRADSPDVFGLATFEG
ncbi:MAG: hypothetical protein IJC43_05370 [Clostridia bacterium]|nr:hypothetical protein [Clostridia bacterium]